MVPFETVEIDEMVAACSGSGGALGHPRVFLNLAPAGRAECPYCSRVFINRSAAQPGAGEAGYSSVATPGVGVAGSTVDAARDDERPPPRQP
ncbi:MAG TPA: zinc-finger domain-containing protein [Stellaceae bacterium]|nr:zinc-finger domain-containing protein [Stellaceae bacterium]